MGVCNRNSVYSSRGRRSVKNSGGSGKRVYSSLESLIIGGVPSVCVFLYNWKLGVAWLVFTLLSGRSKG